MIGRTYVCARPWDSWRISHVCGYVPAKVFCGVSEGTSKKGVWDRDESPQLEQLHVHRGQEKEVETDVELIGIFAGAIVDRLSILGLRWACCYVSSKPAM